MIIDDLKSYQPYNNQERIDKDKFINFINTNKDIFTRSNIDGHITSSCFIVNQNHDKVLMCYHNIYDSYSWLGGHNDGDTSCLNVAIKELKEESGLTNYKLLDQNIFSIEVLKVRQHIKNGKIIKKHLHYNITYLFECNDEDDLHINVNENKDLKWIKFNQLKDYVNEVNMYNNVYLKLINKFNEIIKKAR